MFRSLRWPAATFVAALACLLAFQPVLIHYTAEDSYITFRYVLNAVDGHGLVYNPGEHVEGFSSPLYTLLLILLSRAYKNVILWARLAGFSATVATLVACWLIAKRTSRAPAACFTLIATMLVATPAFHIYATLGMEAPLFMALLTWGAAASVDHRPSGPGMLAVVLFSLVGI